MAEADRSIKIVASRNPDSADNEIRVSFDDVHYRCSEMTTLDISPKRPRGETSIRIELHGLVREP